MALNCLSMCSRCPLAVKSVAGPSTSSSSSPCSSMASTSAVVNFFVPQTKVMMRANYSINGRAKRHVVRMAPEEEKLTRRNPLDFPIEWERPKPGRRPDIFPQFSPMKTPLPPPMPYDPPEEDEEEEEKKEEEEEEGEDPDKEEEDKPENP